MTHTGIEVLATKSTAVDRARGHQSPCVGAWVRDLRQPGSFGVVVEGGTDGSDAVVVDWRRHAHKQGRKRELPARLGGGFRVGMEVVHVPSRRGRRSLGLGQVAAIRRLGGCDQVLVEFWHDARRVWLGYHHLRMVRGVEQRFRQGRLDDAGGAERLRLRCLAHALELWNESTGALSALDIDPLPHQIYVVHQIIASGHLNWMIADDVGLGKTIEVGMLLTALRQRGRCNRILLITPAGLTVQWQEELAQKFRLDDFQIYGRDFNVHEPRHWALHDRVIASMDQLKQPERLESLLQAEPWDLVVFDEAHRLSRRQYGAQFEASDRYKLAAELRNYTDGMILLTATPHQGMHDKFIALLQLIRPDLSRELHHLRIHPEILGELIIRNRKDRVTDQKGELIFKGKTTHAIIVPVSEQAKAFDKDLEIYLKKSMSASARIAPNQRRAIGFVLNTYRKLAASSAAAIRRGLRRRLGRLEQQYEDDSSQMRAPDLFDEHDARYDGEFAEARVEGSREEFFAGERALLETMIAKADAVLAHDAKLKAFLDQVASLIHAQDEERKTVIFTEYRATQKYLRLALEKRFGANTVALIHGGQDHQSRRKQIEHFEDEGLFLISTEAGGEGINLQRRCHTLVNYDLPWNPMRLVQRIGRLYRYGQSKPVLVFNMHAPESLDGSILGTLYQRLEQVVRDMASVSGEFSAGLEDEILGQMASLIDVENILERATEGGVQRTRAEIEAAIEKARAAALLERDLFESVRGYDAGAASHELRMSGAHLRAFVEGSLQMFGAEMQKERRFPAMKLRLPDSILHELPSLKRNIRVTFDREWGYPRTDVMVLDMDSPLVSHLRALATSEDFAGLCAQVAGLQGDGLVVGIARWQNPDGVRLRQEFIALQLFTHGRHIANSEAFSDWLLVPAADGARRHDRDQAAVLGDMALELIDRRLRDVTTAHVQPESRQLIASGWLDSAMHAV